MNASELIKRIAFSKAYEFLDRDPEQNFLKLVDWLERLDKSGYVAQQLPTIRKYASDPTSNWYQLALNLWDDVDSEQRKTLFTNFMINGNLLENQKIAETRKIENCNVPWAILMDTASAGENSPQELSFDEMDDLVEQGKQLGTYFYIFAGGEPLLRRDDLTALCNKNSDCVFLCMTDGLLIDETFAGELLRVRNMIPMLTVDGLAEQTDALRGRGSFARQLRAMEILKRSRLLFGVSCCCTGKNVETMASEAFFDSMIEWGAKSAWFSPYIPDGKDADPSLMMSAEQRESMIRRIQTYRETKPLLTLDCCLSGRITGGCIAGGRGYCHVNARGDVEPCAFFHYTDSNIRSKSLLQAYCSPLFRRFHEMPACEENSMRICPLLDYPDRMKTLAQTDEICLAEPEKNASAEEIFQRCASGAEAWKPGAERLYREFEEEKRRRKSSDESCKA